MTLVITYFTYPYFARKAKRRVHFHHAYSHLDAQVGSPTCAQHVGECLSTGLADDRQCEMMSNGRCNMQAPLFFFFADSIMHKYTNNRPSRSSRSKGVSYITVTRKHSSRRLCTQLGRATLDLMFKSRITTTIRGQLGFFFVTKWVRQHRGINLVRPCRDSTPYRRHLS